MLSNSQQLVEFWLFGLIGFILTLGTFVVAARTRRAVQKAFEVSNFRDKIEDIVSRLDNAVSQIEQNQFEKQDALKLSNFLYRLIRDFTFMPRRTTREMNNSVYLLRSFEPTAAQPEAVSDSLIRVASALKKEIVK